LKEFVYNWSIKNLKVMCLYSTTGKKIAERDIVCYKALGYMKGVYYTPCRHKIVKDSVLSGRRLFQGGLFRKKETIDEGMVTVINGGYIHVATKLAWLRFGYYDCHHFKCIIPKGTEYWVDDNGSEMAARKIRFVERVK
jgi:hypothetical protein